MHHGDRRAPWLAVLPGVSAPPAMRTRTAEMRDGSAEPIEAMLYDGAVRRILLQGLRDIVFILTFYPN